MSATKYTYSISTDFTNAKIAPDRLEQEIRQSAIIIAIDYINTSGDDCDIWFKDTLSSGDETILDGVVGAHSGVPLPENLAPTTSDGSPIVSLAGEQPDKAIRVAQVGRLGTEVIFATHDFADPTTWFGDSERVTDEVLVDSGDGYTFTSEHINWIDMTHGKVFDEDVHAEEVEHNYSVIIKVDNVIVNQRLPFANSGGDYTVNYENGSITFVNSQSGKTVEASYSYENGSTWYMRPLPGKKLSIESAEAQFSVDTIINDTIQFGAFGLVNVFAPQLVDNPIPSGTLIPIATTRYKVLDQIIDEAIGSFPVIPPLGGAIRGNLQARYGFPFRYGSVRVLNSLAGMELRVFLEGKTPFDGERATATFYCSSEDA